MDFAPLFDLANLPSLLTLTLLEVVLGIDNVIFITILAGKLPPEKQGWARRLGLGIALVSRIILLFGISWVMELKNDLFTFMDQGISAKDLILIGGGLFLLAKAVHEIYENVERPDEHQPQKLNEQGHLEPKDIKKFMVSFLVQVVLLDVVFSLDSVITAVGLVNDPSKLIIMVTAVVVSVILMIAFAGPVGDFVQKHASVRVLALSFLVLIGVLLVGEGFGQHIDKGYIYFSMGFALLVEFINMRMRSRRDRMDNNPST